LTECSHTAQVVTKEVPTVVEVEKIITKEVPKIVEVPVDRIVVQVRCALLERAKRGD
jgi:hypothetical protein